MSRRKAQPAGEPAVNEFIQALDSISESHGRYENFRQFLEAAYCTLAKRSALDEARAEALEKRYMAVVAHYAPHQKEVMKRISAMFGRLILVLQGRDRDFLGSVYTHAGFCEEQRGQFFTPPEVCRLMATMTMDRETIERCRAEQRPVRLCEPCCGSGSMVIAAAEAIKALGFDPAEVLLATLIDIDPICMKMAFLQMSLLDIPAICVHGDVLADTEWERAITPAALGQRWQLRRIEAAPQSQSPGGTIDDADTSTRSSPEESSARGAPPATSVPARAELQIQKDLFAEPAED